MILISMSTTRLCEFESGRRLANGHGYHGKTQKACAQLLLTLNQIYILMGQL